MQSIKQIDRLKENWAEFADALSEDKARVPAFTTCDGDMVLFEDRKFDSSVAIKGSLIGARRPTEFGRTSVSAEGVMLVADAFRVGHANAGDVVIGGNAHAQDIDAVHTLYCESDVEAQGKIITQQGGVKVSGNVYAGIVHASASSSKKYTGDAPIVVGGSKLSAKLSIAAKNGSIEVPNGDVISPYISTAGYLSTGGTVVTRALRVGEGVSAYRVVADVAYVSSSNLDKIHVERNEIKKLFPV